jgi:hypothetical protein
MNSTLVTEPNLFFGNNEVNISPKIGLINFGPVGRFTNGKTEPLTIRGGFIGTKKSKQLFESWVEKLKSRITGKVDETTNKREVDFPGMSLDSPLKFQIVIEDNCCEYLSESDINDLEKLPRKERIVKLVSMYEQKFKDLASTTDPHPDLVFLPLSEKEISLCKEPKAIGDRITYARRSNKPRNTDEEYPLFDFHHAMKVIAYKHGKLVCQIVRPSTMNFNKFVQDPATIGWNFAVATYYKATGIPWKLADLDDETCYVGLSFYYEITKKDVNLRTSMAHVYLRTGESQVIRGKPFKWETDTGKSPALSSDLAKEIITDVLELYKRQKNGVLPKRVVIHKTSPFTADEIVGFNKALEKIELADFIHINEKSGIHLFPKSQQYPAIRGTFLYNMTKFLLYTTGYVSLLDSYHGSSVPAPLLLEAYRLNSTPEQIAKDILALTKLDWNNANFNSRLPVTISVSRKVGSILSESSAQKTDLPSNYRYYM